MHLDTLNNYDRLDIADLQRRTENLAVSNRQYEILSERIAELEEIDYDPDADVQIEENREILKIYQDKKIAYKGYCEYVELIEQLETIKTSKRIIGQETVRVFKELEKMHKAFHQTTISVRTLPEVTKLHSTVHTRVDTLRALMDEARDMKGADMPPPTPIHVAPPARPSSLKLEMPKFSGEIVDWHEFWGLFDSQIERETSLSEIEKIGLLETAMTTPKALEIVREASKSRNYDKVAARLKEEYDKPRQIYKYHLNQLLELKPVKDDHDSLGSFR